jgi:hypothetical protein
MLLGRALAALAAQSPDATGLALSSAAAASTGSASGADFWPIWLTASQVVGEQGDRKALGEILAYVDVGSGPWPLGVVVQRTRLQAVIGQDGSLTAEQVETTFQEALGLVRQWGAALYEAHICADYGAWLLGQDRDAEATDLLTSARAFYERVGARRWLDDLDSRIATEDRQGRA